MDIWNNGNQFLVGRAYTKLLMLVVYILFLGPLLLSNVSMVVKFFKALHTRLDISV